MKSPVQHSPEISLDQIAFARSGDKGSSANVAILARSREAYEWLRVHLDAQRVERFFRPFGVGAVTRYEVPNLEAFNFILPGVLAGGASRSLRNDSQGKTLGQVLLTLRLPISEKDRRSLLHE